MLGGPSQVFTLPEQGVQAVIPVYYAARAKL
jgi:hypothetical protein